MKGIIRFVLTVVIGIVLGFLLYPTINKRLEGTKIEKAVKATSEVANEFAQSKLDSLQTK